MLLMFGHAFAVQVGGFLTLEISRENMAPGVAARKEPHRMTPMHTPNLRLEPQGADRAVLWIDMADRPVNVFNSALLADLDAALDHVAAQPDCKVLLISSAKSSGFLAGADLHELAKIATPAAAAAMSERGQRLFDKLADLPQVTIAVIAGPCLGGGLECALACDYRLVVEHPRTQLGLPEVELGLLPAWGGTQRLPRVVGLEPALRMILGRRRLSAQEALRWHLADALAKSDQDLPLVLALLTEHARQQGKRPRRKLPLLNWRQRLIESNPLGRLLVYRGTRRMLRERVPDDMPAPWEALEAVRTGLKKGMPAGLQYEREAVSRLATTPACRNLITLFFLQENARKMPDQAATANPSPAARRAGKIGIVGAGTMGAGIAQLAAIKGFDVIVQEVNDAALAAGMSKIEDLFRKATENRVLSRSEAERKLAAIGRTTSWQGFDSVDLVIEAVIEDLDTKLTIFRELEKRTRPETVLVTNTSSLLVAKLQEGREHPERIGGLHFFNPVHKMPLVEVVRAPVTAEKPLAALHDFAIQLGKVPVVVKDSPGFLVNRILMPYLNEAAMLLAEGVPATMIDQRMTRFGMPIGPLELLDQVGLDVAAHIEKAMRPYFANRFDPNPLFETMRQRGWLGQKSGRGFYRHEGKRKTANPHLRDVIRPADWRDFSAALDLPDQAMARMVLVMVNEAALCLSEGIAADAPTIDLAMIFGTGWAPHRGGPLRYADDRGLKEVVRRLEELGRSHGPRFEPCAELRRRAENNEPFYPRLPIPGDGDGQLAPPWASQEQPS
jgi:3-hydroxyacyl-CoA dehydrogenase/enoyl-CoA hydratase/3-hydroxybutyryl-CoA epimerase